jgi:hypothetical protein
MFNTNVAPVEGVSQIAKSIVDIRRHWGGATWRVDTRVSDDSHVAAEWTMSGEVNDQAVCYHGADHYWITGDDSVICDIHQCWIFSPEKTTSGLIGMPRTSGRASQRFRRPPQPH